MRAKWRAADDVRTLLRPRLAPGGLSAAPNPLLHIPAPKHPLRPPALGDAHSFRCSSPQRVYTGSFVGGCERDLRLASGHMHAPCMHTARARPQAAHAPRRSSSSDSAVFTRACRPRLPARARCHSLRRRRRRRRRRPRVCPPPAQVSEPAHPDADAPTPACQCACRRRGRPARTRSAMPSPPPPPTTTTATQLQRSALGFESPRRSAWRQSQ